MILLDAFLLFKPTPLSVAGIGLDVAIVIFIVLRVGDLLTKNGDSEENLDIYKDEYLEPPQTALSELLVPCVLYVYGSVVSGEPIVCYAEEGSDIYTNAKQAHPGLFLLTGYVGPKLISRRRYEVDTNRAFRPG